MPHTHHAPPHSHPPPPQYTSQPQHSNPRGNRRGRHSNHCVRISDCSECAPFMNPWIHECSPHFLRATPSPARRRLTSQLAPQLSTPLPAQCSTWTRACAVPQYERRQQRAPRATMSSEPISSDQLRLFRRSRLGAAIGPRRSTPLRKTTTTLGTNTSTEEEMATTTNYSN